MAWLGVSSYVMVLSIKTFKKFSHDEYEIVIEEEEPG